MCFFNIIVFGIVKKEVVYYYIQIKDVAGIKRLRKYYREKQGYKIIIVHDIIPTNVVSYKIEEKDYQDSKTGENSELL